MPQTTVAAIQMTCCADPAQNIAHAEELVRQAAAKGAQIVLLPELFERPYFCQERRYEYYDYALPMEENPAIQRFSEVCRELEPGAKWLRAVLMGMFPISPRWWCT